MTYWIATVWMGLDAYDVGTRTIVRLQAVDEDAFRAQVRATWPKKTITFGLVSASKVQG